MVHEIAKLLLERAGNFLQRTEAVRTALSLGMPLSEIEEYLDWLDAVRPGLRQRCQPPEVIDLEAARPGPDADSSAPSTRTTEKRTSPKPGPDADSSAASTTPASPAGQPPESAHPSPKPAAPGTGSE